MWEKRHPDAVLLWRGFSAVKHGVNPDFQPVILASEAVVLNEQKGQGTEQNEDCDKEDFAVGSSGRRMRSEISGRLRRMRLK